MKKIINIIGNIVAAIYFIFPMLLVIFLLIYYPLSFLLNVITIRNSGFAGPNYGGSLIEICGFFIGLSLLIPPLRKMYYALPWLYAFIIISFINMIILYIGSLILDQGYQVVNEIRHTLFFILMFFQILICRFAMCIYFKFKPIKYYEER